MKWCEGCSGGLGATGLHANMSDLRREGGGSQGKEKKSGLVRVLQRSRTNRMYKGRSILRNWLTQLQRLVIQNLQLYPGSKLLACPDLAHPPS